MVPKRDILPSTAKAASCVKNPNMTSFRAASTSLLENAIEIEALTASIDETAIVSSRTLSLDIPFARLTVR
jgi:hypothetical protein